MGIGVYVVGCSRRSSSVLEIRGPCPFSLLGHDPNPLHDPEEAQDHVGDVADRSEEDESDQHSLTLADIVRVSRSRHAAREFELRYTGPPR
jgi:hypothetical protein